MARNKKPRNISAMPVATLFKPQGISNVQLRGVVLELDGFEALRLVDAQGLSQEEAAEIMGISRPTLCRILAKARTRVAQALTQGWAIRIETQE